MLRFAPAALYGASNAHRHSRTNPARTLIENMSSPTDSLNFGSEDEEIAFLRHQVRGMRQQLYQGQSLIQHMEQVAAIQGMDIHHYSTMLSAKDYEIALLKEQLAVNQQPFSSAPSGAITTATPCPLLPPPCRATTNAIVTLPRYYYYSSNGACIITQLPPDAFDTVMAFLRHKDRNTVAATCTTLRKEVESFSQSKLDRLVLTHGDAAIQTDAELPHRCLSWRALTTPLRFTFDTFQGGSETVLLDTSLAEGSDSLVIAASKEESHAFCHVYDYSSGQSLQRVAFPGAASRVQGGIKHMVQCGNLLVVATFESLSVWNWGGERLFFNTVFSVRALCMPSEIQFISPSFRILATKKTRLLRTRLLFSILPILKTLQCDGTL